MKNRRHTPFGHTKPIEETEDPRKRCQEDLNDKDDVLVKKQGVDAFNFGLSDEACPYSRAHSRNGFSRSRMLWMKGFWAASTASRIKTVSIEELMA